MVASEGVIATAQDDQTLAGRGKPIRVLITGATGNIGSKLRSYLEARGCYDLTLLCLNPGNDTDVVTADLSAFDEDWSGLFAGIDTVLHVAADPSPFASWGSIQRLNLDLLFNVMAAAQKHGVRRIVFASSNFVVAGYRFTKDALTADIEPRCLPSDLACHSSHCALASANVATKIGMDHGSPSAIGARPCG